jgi:hypothetical protein
MIGWEMNPREIASMARGQKRARIKMELGKVLYGLERLRDRAIDDVDDLALWIGELE